MNNWLKFYEDINNHLRDIDENIGEKFTVWKNNHLENKVRSSNIFLYDWTEFENKVFPQENSSFSLFLKPKHKDDELFLWSTKLQNELHTFILRAHGNTKCFGLLYCNNHCLLTTDKGILSWFNFIFYNSVDTRDMEPGSFISIYFEENLPHQVYFTAGQQMVNNIFLEFYQTSENFNLTDFLPKEKFQLDNSTFLAELNQLSKTCKEENIDDVLKLNNFINKKISSLNDSFANAIKNDSLNLLKNNLPEFDEDGEIYYNDNPNKEEIYNITYTLEGKINLIESYKLQILFVIGMIDSKNLMIQFLREDNKVLFKELKYKLDDLGVYLTKFESENLKKLDLINKQLKDLIDSVQEGLQSINDTLEDIRGSIESVDGQLNKLNSKANASLLLSAINTYQMYKLNKNLKIDYTNP
jgi:hypothetical protein